MHYYALKVFLNKVFELESLLNERMIFTFIPTTTETKIKDGKKIEVRKLRVTSLLFLQCEEETAKELQRELYGRAMFYTHCNSYQPYAIPDAEMEMFIKFCSMADRELEFMDADSINYKQGQRVRVIEGDFKGAEGYIKRIKGNRRLIIAIEGVVAIATTYIPQAFLEPIE